MASNEPDLFRVIKKMLSKPYNGRVLFTHLPKMSPEDFSEDNFSTSIPTIKLWFSEKSDYFATFTNDKNPSRVVMISIRFRGAKICWRYQIKNKPLIDSLKSQLSIDDVTTNNDNESCKDENCQNLHLCKNFSGKNCCGFDCGLNHTLDAEFEENDTNNIASWKDVFGKVSQDMRDKITVLSQIQICHNYNHLGSCNYEDSCTRLHVCQKYVEGTCSKKQQDSSSECSLSHKLTSTHSLRLLNTYNIWYNPDNILSVLLQISTDVSSFEPARRNRLNKLLPDSNLLEDMFCQFIRPSSPLLLSTHENENDIKVLPIEWKFCLMDVWEKFDDKVGYKIESSYSDPNNDEITVKTPSDMKELGLGDKLTISFVNMEATLDDGQQKIKIQRLETANSSNNQLLYMWYYKDNKEVWDLLPDNDKIEETYKNGQKRYKFIFENTEHRIKFEDMTLKDLRKGNSFMLKRRPLWLD